VASLTRHRRIIVAFNFDATGECHRGEGPVPPSIPLRGSVGRFGQNIAADVKLIQDALNGISQGGGGPLPALKVDGVAGPKTIGAIEKFQRVQFAGLPPDGLISPGKRTIDRLNSMQGGGGPVTSGGSRFGITSSFGDPQTTPDQMDLARRLALDAEKRIANAISRLVLSTTALLKPVRTAAETQLVREVNHHFKASADPNPAFHLSKVSAIYTFMLAAVRGSNNGAREIFKAGTHPDPNAIAAADLGGFFSASESKRFIIITPNFRTASSAVIVHELAHFCGGDENSGRDIVHRASPKPPPNGTRKEDGSTDYANMTPFFALTNVFSYTVYCFPEFPEFKVP
jgi:hypothetical protein